MWYDVRRTPTSSNCVQGARAAMPNTISITVNGERKDIRPGTTVAELISELGLGDRRVAVERNRDVVPRARHGHVVLAGGDRLELVAFVGGGI